MTRANDNESPDSSPDDNISSELEQELQISAEFSMSSIAANARETTTMMIRLGYPITGAPIDLTEIQELAWLNARKPTLKLDCQRVTDSPVVNFKIMMLVEATDSNAKLGRQYVVGYKDRHYVPEESYFRDYFPDSDEALVNSDDNTLKSWMDLVAQLQLSEPELGGGTQGEPQATQPLDFADMFTIGSLLQRATDSFRAA